MKTVKLLFIVIAALVITSVTYSNHSVSDSQLVGELSSEINALEKQITLTEAEIAQAGSLTQIASKVEEMGYERSTKVVSVYAPSNVASR